MIAFAFKVFMLCVFAALSLSVLDTVNRLNHDVKHIRSKVDELVSLLQAPQTVPVAAPTAGLPEVPAEES